MDDETVDRAGEVGLSPNPSWSGVLNLNYARDRWSLFVQERFIGAGRYDDTRIDGVTINDNHVGSEDISPSRSNWRYEPGRTGGAA